MIQVVNSEGLFSKYQASGASNTEISPYFQTSGTMSGMAVSDGQATGVLRVENKTVKSGIDNSIFEKEGPKTLFLTIPPLCSTAELTTISSITIEIDAIVDESLISENHSSRGFTGVAGGGQTLQTLSQTLTGLDTASGGTEIEIAGGMVSRVLKVTYKNPKYVGASGATAYDENDAYKFLKIFVCVKPKHALEDGSSEFSPITYVSAGCPIQKANDPLRNVTLDFSQSRAKASNVSLDSYRYDNGKAWWTYKDIWGITGNIFTDTTKQTSSIKNIAYTYSPRVDGIQSSITIETARSIAFGDSTNFKWQRDFASNIPPGSTSQLYRTDQFIVDRFGRFTDQYHFTRMSADPNTTDKDGTGNVSSISDNKPYVFRVTPTILSTMSLSTTPDSATKLDIAPVASGNFSRDYTTQAFNNLSGTSATTLKGEVRLIEMNTQTFQDISGNTRDDEEYLLLLFPEKTNKLFFDIANYANSLMTVNLSGGSFPAADTGVGAQWRINGVSYLTIDESGTRKQNAYWTPVEFEDTTKVSMEYKNDSSDKYEEQSNSLSQSGFVSFDMPLDWSATTLTNLCGGQFDTAMTTSTSGANDFLVTGTADTDFASDNADFGEIMKLTSLTATSGITGGLIDEDIFGTDEDIGAFKYIAFCVDTGSSTAANCENKPFWLASGASAGTDSNREHLYFTYGEEDTTYEPKNLDGNTGVEMLIRRVNIYDVINGVSKVTMGDGDSAVHLVPVDCNDAAFPSTYIVDDTSTSTAAGEIGAGLKSAWNTTDLYALKISLSGAAGVDATSDDKLYPSVWNIFDANRGYGDIIKEVDDTAYNLNALPITSDIAVNRKGTYYQAITRKGKVFISRTGDTIENIGFSSVGLGNRDSSTAFEDYGSPSALYGQLRNIRNLHAEVVRVYWDEVQKDGTFVRYWGVIDNVSETHGSGGGASILSNNFNVIVEGIALIDKNGNLMTDIFPLGGVGDGKTYT